MIRHSSKVMTEGRGSFSQVAAFNWNGPKSRRRKTSNAATAIAVGSSCAFRTGGRPGQVRGRCVDAGQRSFLRSTRCVRAERVRQERAVLKRSALGRPTRRVPGIDIPLERERYGCRRPFRVCRGSCAGNAGGEGKWCEVRSISG